MNLHKFRFSDFVLLQEVSTKILRNLQKCFRKRLKILCYNLKETHSKYYESCPFVINNFTLHMGEM